MYIAAAKSMRAEYIIIYSERGVVECAYVWGEYDVRKSMCVYVWDEKGRRVDYYRQLWCGKRNAASFNEVSVNSV